MKVFLCILGLILYLVCLYLLVRFIGVLLVTPIIVSAFYAAL